MASKEEAPCAGSSTQNKTVNFEHSRELVLQKHESSGEQRRVAAVRAHEKAKKEENECFYADDKKLICNICS